LERSKRRDQERGEGEEKDLRGAVELLLDENDLSALRDVIEGSVGRKVHPTHCRLKGVRKVERNRVRKRSKRKRREEIENGREEAMRNRCWKLARSLVAL